MESARTKLGNVFEGWNKWQIAAAVGAPIALGLAGLWFYNRGKRKTANETNDSLDSSPTTDEVPKSSSSSSAQEVDRPKTPLEQAVAVKAKGNKYFKGGNYDKAIECYSEAILVCPDDKTQDLSTFYQNRAAAYEQLRNNTKVIEDCTKALEYNAKYLKALSRRQKASEAIGSLTLSLEDITAVCILEGFQNQQSLVIADRVLKDLGKKHAKDAFKMRKPSLPSILTIKHYFRDFPSDPIINLASQELSKPETNKYVEDNSSTVVINETEINKNISITENQETEDINDPEEIVEVNENHTDDGSNEQDEDREISVSDSNDNSISVAEEEQNTTNQLPERPVLNGDIIQSKAEDSPFMKARTNLLDEKYDNIIDLCTEELTITDSQYLAEARLLRATFYVLSGLELQAMNDLKAILSKDNITKLIRVNALIKRGGLFMRQEQQTESLGDFATAVRIDPNNADVYHQRGQQNLLLERLDDAQSDFDKSISLNPTFAISHVQRCYAVHKSALMLQSPLQMQKSLKAFEETIKKFPCCSDAYVLYGQALCDNGQFAEAETQFKLALNLEPENANILVHCGLLQLQWKQNVDEAITLINKAIAVDDKCEYAYEVLGTIEVQKANMDRAVELFNRAIELCKSESEMVHLFSLLAAAKSQLKVASNLGIQLPGSQVIPPS